MVHIDRILIFINKSPIHWYIKRYSTVEEITFVEDFCAMKIGVAMVEALHYKLRMFGITIYGSANVLCDNETVYNKTITPESVLKKKHHSID